MTEGIQPQRETLFGHPAGLFTLFFAEMWERFSYYGMRALLVFYMIKGFLGKTDKEAYAIYGAYTALVYATPFIGGMLADRLLGARRAVVLGGLLMAAGHLLMTVENSWAFFTALALLIAGNGFFKPNISTIVGSLYPEGSTRRDGGFTIFYMGINLGAAMSPLLCGYVGETYGWHYGFGLATLGMLVGVAVFVAPILLTQILILGGALAAGITLLLLTQNPYLLAVNGVVGVALIVAGVIACMALSRGGLPREAGAAPDPAALRRPLFGKLPIPTMWGVYGGVLLSIPLLAILVQRNAVAGWILSLLGGLAFLYLLYYALRSEKIERERLFVILILFFFSMLFWSFFEQAGSSVNNFTDRNVDRVFATRTVTAEDVGKTIEIELTQKQLGYRHGETLWTLDKLDAAREAARKTSDRPDESPGETGESKEQEPEQEVARATVQWTVAEEHVGMSVAELGQEIPASTFQAVNPIYILLFGLVFTWLWGFLGARGLEPSTPLKFALGLLQLGLGFGCFWYGAQTADGRGMVAVSWLMTGYLLQTTGELCLSPVGLSMVTKLSPAKIVSTVMGAWFLATAFSNYLAGVIAKMTGVSHGGGEEATIPPPADTVNVYGDVFGKISIAAMISAAICLCLVPLLKAWMHEPPKEEKGKKGKKGKKPSSSDDPAMSGRPDGSEPPMLD